MNNKLTLATGLLLGAALTLPALAAEKSPREKAVDYRQSLMTLVGDNFKPMGAMVKGKIPYDAKQFERYARDLEAVSHLDVLRGFPPDSDGQGSEAKPEIWFEWDDFTAKLQDMQDATRELRKVAASGDPTAIKAQFTKTAKACKACHKKFKE